MHLGLRTISPNKRLASSSQCPCIWSRSPHFAWPPRVQHLAHKKSKLLGAGYKDLELGVWSNIPNHRFLSENKPWSLVYSLDCLSSYVCGPHPCLWYAKVWPVERSPRDFEQSQWHSDEKQKSARPRCQHPKFELLLASIWTVGRHATIEDNLS